MWHNFPFKIVMGICRLKNRINEKYLNFEIVIIFVLKQNPIGLRPLAFCIIKFVFPDNNLYQDKYILGVHKCAIRKDIKSAFFEIEQLKYSIQI